MNAIPGTIVNYRLTEHDAEAIARTRLKSAPPQRAEGNVAHVGEYYPAMVVRSFGGAAVNLQVFLDGPDSYWATSRMEGTGEGTWFLDDPGAATH